MTSGELDRILGAIQNNASESDVASIMAECALKIATAPDGYYGDACSRAIDSRLGPDERLNFDAWVVRHKAAP